MFWNWWKIAISEGISEADFKSTSRKNVYITLNISIEMQVLWDHRSVTSLNKRPWHRCCSPPNLAKFLRTPFLQTTSWRLLLHTIRNSLILLCWCYLINNLLWPDDLLITPFHAFRLTHFMPLLFFYTPWKQQKT